MLYSEEIFDFDVYKCIVTPFYKVKSIWIAFLLNVLTEYFYLKKGSLRAQINEKKLMRKNFEENTVFKWVKDIITGLVFLHEKKIIHQDIKPE